MPSGSKHRQLALTRTDLAAVLSFTSYASSVVVTPIVLLELSRDLSFSRAGGAATLSLGLVLYAAAPPYAVVLPATVISGTLLTVGVSWRILVGAVGLLAAATAIGFARARDR